MAIAPPSPLAPPSDDAEFEGEAETTSAALEVIRADRISGAEPFALVDGMTLIQGTDIATFNTPDFVDIGAATVAEVVSVIIADWIINSATDTAGEYSVSGDGVLSGTALAALGLSADPNMVETTFTIAGPARIMAMMDISGESVGGGVNAVGGWAVQINGVNGKEFDRFLSGTNDRMMGGASMRSDVLPPGTYTIRGMHRRVSGSKTVRTDTTVLLAWPVAAA